MRKRILRIVSLLLAMLMLAGMGPQVFALNLENGFVAAEAVNAPDSSIAPDSIGDYEGLKAYIFSKVSACETNIPISSYSIQNTEENRNAVFSIVQKDFPEFFHIATLKVSYSGGYLVSLIVEYTMTKAAYTQALAAVDAKAAYLLRGIEGSSLSDAEKVMLVHDRLAVYAEYDYPSSKEHEDDTYTIYGTLINGVAVCQGYAQTFVYLTKKLGIQSRTITSDKLNHTWNIVTLGGKEYHVDVTWDDKVLDVYGRVYHDNLLRSTEGIKSTGHTADDYTSSATDTKYEKYYWIKSLTEIQLFNGKLYYINSVDNTLRELTPGSTTSTVLVTVEKQWSNYYMTLANGDMVICFSNLSSDENFIYYTSPTAVIKFDTATNRSETVYSPALSGSGYKIYGFKAYNGKFYLDINNSPLLGTSTRKDYGIVYPYSVNYTIVYNANGGSNAPAATVKEHGRTVKISSTVPTRTGYGFEGWSESANSNTAEYKANDNYTENRSVTLYAVWTPNSYQVTFDANTGTCATAVKAVLFGKTYGDLPTPVKTACEFIGWYTSLGSTGRLVTKNSVVNTASDHTLYAVWKGNEYTITFDAAGGTVSPSTMKVNYGVNVASLPTPVKNGWDFAGWFDDHGELFVDGAMYTYENDITLTARWEAPKHKVFFDANGGTVSISEQSMAPGAVYENLPVPERTGYNFLGWYDKLNNRNITEGVDTFAGDNDVILYARWEGLKFTLTFDSSSGEKYKSVTYGSAIGELPKPINKAGYKFSGWYVDGIKIGETTVWKSLSNRLAVAKWIFAPELKIHGIEDSITVNYRTTVTLTSEYEKTSELNNAELRWIVNGDQSNYKVGSKLVINEIKKSCTVQCQLVVDDEVVSQSQLVTINVKKNIFTIIAAFILSFFGLLPKYPAKIFTD